MAATCAQADGQAHDIQERKMDRKLSRRDATIILDTVPEKMFQRPKVIYRRISKKRYAPPKATYGPPRPKYGPPRSVRKPGKKYRGSSKYGPPSHKKRAPKPRYGVPKRQAMKPVYGPPKVSPHRPYQSESTGFAEPPTSFASKPQIPKNRHPDFQRPNFDDYQKPDMPDFPHQSLTLKPNFEHDFSSPASFGNDYASKPFSTDYTKPTFQDYQIKQSYGEPPVDSYGAPIKPNLHDLTFPTAHAYPDETGPLDQDYNMGSDQSWKNFKDHKPDNSFAYSKKLPNFSKPGTEVFVTPAPQEFDEELSLNSYSDIYNFRQTKEKKKKKASYYNNVKIMNQPWKGSKVKDGSTSNEEVIVGGQYAEPPARYVPKFQPSAPMFTDEGDFSPPYSFPDPDMVSSATMSSYVNYKNSNMAFSPQNLNDAFSIVDK